MAIQPPCSGTGGCSDSTFARALYVLDTVFTACFTVEILMQTMAHCFVLGPNAYLHDGWNWIDLLSTACGYLAFLPAANGGGINGLRALRALRPLRALKAIPGLKLLVQCLLELVPLLMDVLFLLVWVFFVFGIIGLNLFMGSLHHRCSVMVNATSQDAAFALVALAAAGGGAGEGAGEGGGPPMAPPPMAPAALNGSEVLPQWLVVVPGLENQPCSESGTSGAFICDDTWEGYNVTCGGENGNPNFGYAGFDNFGIATFNIFAVMTLDAWSETQLYPQWYAMGPPVPVLFFYALVMFGAFFTMQLLVAIMSSKFAQLADKAVSQPPSRSATRTNLLLDDTVEPRMSHDGAPAADPNGPAAAFAAGAASSPGGRPRSAASAACWRGVRAVASALHRMDVRWEAACAAASRGVYNFRLRYMQPVHRVTLPPWRKRCLKVVSSAWFNNGMTVLIIINTAALGMEHYGISKPWLAAVDIINLVLTYVFIAELVLKHVAMGFIRYWTDPWNVLDGFIVAVSIADLIVVATGGSKTGTQAFRTMRVLRVLRSLKLLRRVKGLHRLLRMVLRGFYTLRDFILLLALFVFVFAVLGFQQFGGLWSFTPEANPLWPLKSRSNFNTMWSSAYTVFQILTCDDWLRITWNGMRGAGNASVLYFMTWVVIGNFILLTLFLAILITSFQSDEDEAAEDVEKTEPSFAGVDGPSSAVSVGSAGNRSGIRHRGVGGSGAVTPRGGGGGGAGGSAYGGNRRRPANALQLRVRERVSERLDPASVRIMKRWLIMMGVTHGMKDEEVQNIIRECDARLSHDPDYINRDTSFTAPHLLNRRALQQAALSASQAGAGAGGGGGPPLMKRGSTLHRPNAATVDMPTMPQDREPSHALTGLPAAAAAASAGAGELGAAPLARSDGEAGGGASGPEERSVRNGRATPKLSRSATSGRTSVGSRGRAAAGVSRAGTAERRAGGGSGTVSRVGTGERSSAYSRAGTGERTRAVSRAGTGERERTSAMSRVGTGDRTSAGTYRSSRRGGSGRTPRGASPAPSPFEAAAALGDLEEASEYDGGATVVGPGPVSGGPSLRGAAGAGQEDGGRTSGGSATRSALGSAQASAPLPLTDRPSGATGVAGLLERLSHAVRSKVLGGMRSGGVSPRTSMPGAGAGERGERGHGGRGRVDLAPPPPSPYGTATPHGPYAASARRSAAGMDGSRGVSGGGASPHGAQSPGGQLNAGAAAGPGPSRMGRGPAPVRQDSWAMLVPSTDALRAAAAAAARQQQIMDDAYVRHRLQTWLHDSQVALRANSLTSMQPSPFAAPGVGPGAGTGGLGGGGGGAFSQQGSLQRRASEAASSLFLHTIAETPAGGPGGEDAGPSAAALGSLVGGNAASGGGASVAAVMSRVVSRGRDASSTNILPTLPSMQRRLTRDASANAAGSNAAAAAAVVLAEQGSMYGPGGGGGGEDDGPDPVTEQLKFSEGTRQRRLLLRAISRERHMPGPGQLVAAGSLPRTGSRGAAAAEAVAAAAGGSGADASSPAAGAGGQSPQAPAPAGGEGSGGGAADTAASASASRALPQRSRFGFGLAGTSAAEEANASLTQLLQRSFRRRHSMPSQDPDTLENVRVMLGVSALLNGSPADGGNGFGIAAAGGGGSGRPLQPFTSMDGPGARGFAVPRSSFATRAGPGEAAGDVHHPGVGDYATEPLLLLKEAVARLESLGLVAESRRGSGAHRSPAGRARGYGHSRLGEAPREEDERTLSGRTDNERTISGRTGDGTSGGEERGRYSLDSAAGTSSMEGLGRSAAQYSGSGVADGRTSNSTRGDSIDAGSSAAQASSSGAAGAPEPAPRSPRFWSELGGASAAARQHVPGGAGASTSGGGGGAGAGAGVVADRLLSRGRQRGLLRRHSHSGSECSVSRGASPSRMGPGRNAVVAASSSAKPSSSGQLPWPLAPALSVAAFSGESAAHAPPRVQQRLADRAPEIQPAYGIGAAGGSGSSGGGAASKAAAAADAAEHRRQALALHHVFGEQTDSFFRRSRTLPDDCDEAGIMAAVAAAAAAELHLGPGAPPAGRGHSAAGGVGSSRDPSTSGPTSNGPPRPSPLVPPPPLVIPLPAGATPVYRQNLAHAQQSAGPLMPGPAPATFGTPASNAATAGSRASGSSSLAPSSASSVAAGGPGALLRGGSSLRRQAAASAAAATAAAHGHHGGDAERAAAAAASAAALAEAAATPGSGASSGNGHTPSTTTLHDMAAAMNRFHRQQPWALGPTGLEAQGGAASAASHEAGAPVPAGARPPNAATRAAEGAVANNPFFDAGPEAEVESEGLTGAAERDFAGDDMLPVALFGNPLARISPGSSRTSRASRQVLPMLPAADAAALAAAGGAGTGGGGGARGAPAAGPAEHGGGSRTGSAQSITTAPQLAAAAAVAAQLAALRQGLDTGGGGGGAAGAGAGGVDSMGIYSKSPSGRSAATAATDPTPLPNDQLLLLLDAEAAVATMQAASGGAGNRGSTAAAVAAALAGGNAPTGATNNDAVAADSSLGSGIPDATGRQAGRDAGNGVAAASQPSSSVVPPSPFTKSLSGRSPDTGLPAWEEPRSGAAGGVEAGVAAANGNDAATAVPPARKFRVAALAAAAATALAARRGATAATAASGDAALRARRGTPPPPPAASLSLMVQGMLRAENTDAASELSPAPPSFGSMAGEQLNQPPPQAAQSLQSPHPRQYTRQSSASQPIGPVAEATESASSSLLAGQAGGDGSGHGKRSGGATGTGLDSAPGVDVAAESWGASTITVAALALAPGSGGAAECPASGGSGVYSWALGAGRGSVRGSTLLLSANGSATGGASLNSPSLSTGAPAHESVASRVSSFGTPLLPMPPASTQQHTGVAFGGAGVVDGRSSAGSGVRLAGGAWPLEAEGAPPSGSNSGTRAAADAARGSAGGRPARGWADRVSRLPLPQGAAPGEAGAAATAAGGPSARSAAVQQLLRGLLVSALRRRTEAAAGPQPLQPQPHEDAASGVASAAREDRGAPGPVCEGRTEDGYEGLPDGSSPAGVSLPQPQRLAAPGPATAPAVLESPVLGSGGSPIAAPFTRLSGFNTDRTATPPADSVAAVPGPGAAALVHVSAVRGSAGGFGSLAAIPTDPAQGAGAAVGGGADSGVDSAAGSVYGSGGPHSGGIGGTAAAATGPRRGFLPPRLQVVDGLGGQRPGPGSAYDALRSPHGSSPLGPLGSTGAASAGPTAGGGAQAGYSSYGNSGYGNSGYGTHSGYSGYGSGQGTGTGTGTTSTPRVSAPGTAGGGGGSRRPNPPPPAGGRRPPPIRTVSSRRRGDRDHYQSHGSRTLSPARRATAVSTDTWTPKDVARARAAGGPRDAAEMEAALFAPMQMAAGRDPVLSAIRQRTPMAPASRQISRQNTRRRRGSAAQLSGSSITQARGDSSYGVLTSPSAAVAAAHTVSGVLAGGVSRSASFVTAAAAAAARLLSGGRVSTTGSGSRRDSHAGTGTGMGMPVSPRRASALAALGPAAVAIQQSAPHLPDLVIAGATESGSARGARRGGGGSAGAHAAVDSPADTDHSAPTVFHSDHPHLDDNAAGGAVRPNGGEDASVARRRLAARLSASSGPGAEGAGASPATDAAGAVPAAARHLGSSGSPQHGPLLVDPSSMPRRGHLHPDHGRDDGHDGDDDDDDDGAHGRLAGLTDVEDQAGALLGTASRGRRRYHLHGEGGLDDDDVAMADEERDQMGEYGKHGGGEDGEDAGGEDGKRADDGGEYGSDLFEDEDEDPAPYLHYSACWVLRPYHPLRLLAAALINHRWFDNAMLVVILASSATLAVDTPRLDKSSPLGRAVTVLDIIFTTIFTIEMVIKLVAKGVVLHPHAYLRNGWDVLDGFIVLTSLLSLGVSGAGAGALKAVRLVRALRPLRLVKRWRGMRLVVETLIRSLPTLAEVVAFGAFMFTIFGILGVQLFAGRFSICNQTVINGTRVEYRSQCVEGVEFTCTDYDMCEDGPGSTEARWWGPPMRNFDHLGRALLTLFTVVTLDGFMEVAWSCMDATGYDQVPQLNKAPWMGLYVIAFVFLGSFFWVNVLVSVIIDHYARLVEEQGDLLVTKQAKEYMKIFKFERVGKDVWKGGCPPGSNWLRRGAWAVGSHARFDQAVLATICINIAAMAAVYDGSSRAYDVALGMVNVACTLIFAIEAAVKITALGWRKYWRDNWNKLDLFIVLVSIPDIVATFTSHNAATGIVTAMRLLRVCRMFKLIRGAKGLRTLFNTLITSLPAIANVGSLLLLIMYIYAVIGINMYGGYGSPFDQPGSIADYNDIGAAMSTQFRLFSADGWGDLMAQGMGCNGNQYQCDTGAAALGAAVFFCSFVLLATFIMLNLVIAVVLDNFIDNAQLEGFLKTSNFVDLLRMVITLRVFVRLMRIKIDLLRQVDRSRALANGPRLASKRLMRSRASTLGGLSVATGGGLSVATGGGLGGGGGGGGPGSVGGPGSGPINSPSVVSMSSRVSGELLPRLAKAVSRLGGSGRLHSGSLAALLGLGSPDAAGGGSQGLLGAAGGGGGGGAPQRRASNASILLSTIQPVLPRRQDSVVLMAAEAIAARAAVAAAAGSTGGGSGTAAAAASMGAGSGTTGTTSFAGTLPPSAGRRRMTADDAAALAAPGTPRTGGDGPQSGGTAGGSNGPQSGGNSDGEGPRSAASSGGRSHRSAGSGSFLGLRDLREAVLRRRRRKSLLGMHSSSYAAAVATASAAAAAAAGPSGGASPHAHQLRNGAGASSSAAQSPSAGGSAAEPSMSNADSGGTHTDCAVSSAGGAGPSSGDRPSHGRGRAGRGRGGGHSRRALPYSGLILATAPAPFSGAASTHSGAGGGTTGSASSLTLLPGPAIRLGGEGSSRPGSPLPLPPPAGRRRSMAGGLEGYSAASPLARSHAISSGVLPVAVGGERRSSPLPTPRSLGPTRAARPYGGGSGDGTAPVSGSSPTAATTTPTRASASAGQVDTALPAAAFGSVVPVAAGVSGSGVSGSGGTTSGGAADAAGTRRSASGGGGGGGGAARGAASRHRAALLASSGALGGSHGGSGSGIPVGGGGGGGGGSHHDTRPPSRLSSMSAVGPTASYAAAAAAGAAVEPGPEHDAAQPSRPQHTGSPLPPRSPPPATTR
ncbi:hypothetical protein HYH02_001605 [Chlamydomonas schloesseri]|uniref:Ion transport domain-containing protein n=1 Tax=Chlamydomonas schloesseri TaxID=2026947 RepID=A0A836BBA0_9CHLO|nr:hypothetical protein HYH02_001605 [Chlamydomonas schloesseri]|eukprot:KAG2453381.1 hypothetical protein HYH02_001605 [Chlamydomonas schloesseri]